MAPPVADVERVVDSPHAVKATSQLLSDLTRPVPTAVIDYQDLEIIEKGFRRLENVENRPLKVQLLIEGGDYYRDLLSVQTLSPSISQAAVSNRDGLAGHPHRFYYRLDDADDVAALNPVREGLSPLLNAVNEMGALRQKWLFDIDIRNRDVATSQ